MARYLIIGNGVTGTRAAELIRRKAPDDQVTLLTEEEYPFYRRPQLPDFAAGRVAGAGLWGKRSNFYDEHDISLRLSSAVEEIDADKGEVILAGGERLGYDGLLIATGRRPLPGDMPGSDLQGINCMKTLREAKEIREWSAGAKTAAVAGDGMLALELVRALTGAGFQTTYFVPGEKLWPEVLDEDTADIAAARVRASGAELVFGGRVAALEGDAQGRARALVLEDGTRVEAGVIGVCTRYEPAVRFLPGGADSLSGDGYATIFEGVWAAGDVTVPTDTPYFNWLRSWRQGAAAGSAMLGLPATEKAELDLLNMQVLGLSLVAIGKTTVAYRSGYREMRGEYPYGEFYKKLVFDSSDVLVGALLVGNIAEAGALEEAVRAGLTQDQLDPRLLHQMFDVTYRTEYLGVQCPVCRHEIQLSVGAAEGDRITCPICGVDFTLKTATGRGFVAKIAP
ncbi:MAG: FAD-dependent oxidoreductase [Thermoleophilia bacterium]